MSHRAGVRCYRTTLCGFHQGLQVLSIAHAPLFFVMSFLQNKGLFLMSEKIHLLFPF
jgi:hypothetical protein